MDDSPVERAERTLDKYVTKRMKPAELTLADVAKAPASLVPDYHKEAEAEFRAASKRYYDVVAELEAIRTENDRLRRRCQMLEEELGQNYLRAVMSLRNAEMEPPKG